MHCRDTGIIGHPLCLAHLQRNLYFGSMMSQKVKNQMDTLCLSFQYEGPSLITERTKPAHSWISSHSQTLPLALYRKSLRSEWFNMQPRLLANLFQSGCVIFFSIFWHIVVLFAYLLFATHFQNNRCWVILTLSASIPHTKSKRWLNSFPPSVCSTIVRHEIHRRRTEIKMYPGSPASIDHSTMQPRDAEHCWIIKYKV